MKSIFKYSIYILFTLLFTSCVSKPSITGEWTLIATETQDSIIIYTANLQNTTSNPLVIAGKNGINYINKEKFINYNTDTIQKVLFKWNGNLEYDQVFNTRYTTWFKLQKHLIFSGDTHFKTNYTNYFDTFDILTLTKDSLIICNDNNTMYFIK